MSNKNSFIGNSEREKYLSNIKKSFKTQVELNNVKIYVDYTLNKVNNFTGDFDKAEEDPIVIDKILIGSQDCTNLFFENGLEIYDSIFKLIEEESKLKNF